MKMPNMVVTTIAAIIIITVLGYYARDDGRIGSGEVGLEVGAPITHQLSNGKTTPLPVVLRLVNNTDETIPLVADGPCKIFRYVVTTSGGDFIQAVRTPENCSETREDSALAENDTLQEVRQVPLDTKRYAAGDYVVRVKFWNYEGKAAFELTE